MKGVEFFPLDVHLSDEVELIEAEYGLEGFAVFIKILQKIYGGEGYFCDWQDDNILLFSKQTGSENSSQIVKKCIERGLFDKEMFEHYKILTSAGIQRRYLKITERRKYSGIKPEYDVNKKKNVCKIEKNVDIFQQSKVKESKVKESKERKPVGFIPPTIEEVKKYIIDNYYNVNPERFVDFYTSKNWYVGKNKMKDWKAAVRGWHSREKKDGAFKDYSLKTSYDYDKIEAKALNFGKEIEK